MVEFRSAPICITSIRRATADRQEHWRLLYVAMTRAEEALFIGGALGKREKEPAADSWFARLAPLFDAYNVTEQLRKAMGRKVIELLGIETTDPDFLRKVLEVNTLAPFALIRTALPQLRKTKGCVLNIGSVNAWSGEPKLLAYSISKGALVTLTRNLGDTLFRDAGVRVNQINPGWVLTEREIQRKEEQGLEEDWYKDIPKVFAPSGRLLWPAEIAAAAVYWLSDECGPVSGQVVDLEQYPLAGRNPPKEF